MSKEEALREDHSVEREREREETRNYGRQESSTKISDMALRSPSELHLIQPNLGVNTQLPHNDRKRSLNSCLCAVRTTSGLCAAGSAKVRLGFLMLVTLSRTFGADLRS